MNATLSWGECQTHGHTLLGFMGRCALCHERKTKPAPKHRRRTFSPTIGRGGIASIDLTPAERRVAEMLAAGKSRRSRSRASSAFTPRRSATR